MATILELSPETCERLLRAGVFGRVVLTSPARPEIVPVNYVAVDGAVLIRTSPGSLLDRQADGADLLFEVDNVDYERWHGWSVVARGRGERVAPDRLTDEERRAPGPPRWVSRVEESWIRLRWDSLSGRRLGKGWNCLEELPVRRVSL